MRTFCSALALIVGLTNVPAADDLAQTASSNAPSAKEPRFDVVAIRPLKENDGIPTNIINSARSGSLRAVNVNLKALLEVAFQIPDLRMYGGPEWISTARFSLDAKADPALDWQLAALPPNQAREIKRKMLITLLEDRFKLRAHTETRDMPIYALVIAKEWFEAWPTEPQRN